MKKIYSCLTTLICFSFLFVFNSCSANTSFLLSSAIKNDGVEKRISYYKSIKDDAITTSTENLCNSAARYNNDFIIIYYMSQNLQRGMMTYAITTDIEDPIDPDWRKLVGHIIAYIV